MNNYWGSALAVAFWLMFFCLGMLFVFNPDWFIKRSGVLKGGQLLTAWNRLGFRIAGAVMAGASVYVLYDLWR